MHFLRISVPPHTLPPPSCYLQLLHHLYFSCSGRLFVSTGYVSAFFSSNYPFALTLEVDFIIASEINRWAVQEFPLPHKGQHLEQCLTDPVCDPHCSCATNRSTFVSQFASASFLDLASRQHFSPAFHNRFALAPNQSCLSLLVIFGCA